MLFLSIVVACDTFITKAGITMGKCSTLSHKRFWKGTDTIHISGAIFRSPRQFWEDQDKEEQSDHHCLH